MCTDFMRSSLFSFTYIFLTIDGLPDIRSARVPTSFSKPLMGARLNLKKKMQELKLAGFRGSLKTKQNKQTHPTPPTHPHPHTHIPTPHTCHTHTNKTKGEKQKKSKQPTSEKVVLEKQKLINKKEQYTWSNFQ